MSTLTDAERVNVLLDETKRLRAIAAYKLQADGDDLAKLLAIRDAPILEQMAALRQELELSEATNAELRGRLDVLQRDARETRELGRRGLELLAAACRERDEALAKLAVAVAEEEEASRLGKDTLRLMQQMRDERDAALARLERPSATFTAFRLLAVVATTAVVSGAAGAEAVMRWLPW